MSETKALDITLYGRQFRLACAPGEEKHLLASVAHVEKRLREVQDAGKVTGADRVALLAALNIAHEFMNKRGRGMDQSEIKQRIDAMTSAVERVLSEQDKLF